LATPYHTHNSLALFRVVEIPHHKKYSSTISPPVPARYPPPLPARSPPPALGGEREPRTRGGGVGVGGGGAEGGGGISYFWSLKLSLK
jgi:hypothetical protein